MANHQTEDYVNYPSEIPMPSYPRLRYERPAHSIQDKRSLDDILIELDSRSQPPPKFKEEPPPTIYLDIPDNEEIQERLRDSEDEDSFVQETIFYDPFKDRRINIPIDENRFQSVEENHVQNVDGQTENRQIRPTRPAPPTPLFLNGLGTTRILSASPLSRESSLYSATSEDGLIISPITLQNPIDAPPEYGTPYRSQSIFMTDNSARMETPNVITSVRTVTGNPAQSRRKCIACNHCGKDVQTIVIRQAGVVGHFLAALFSILMLGPFTFIVYWTDWFKNENHYCPQCNNRIGYEIPIIKKKFTYTKKK